MHQLGFVDQRLIIFTLFFLNCCCFFFLAFQLLPNHSSQLKFCFLCFNPLIIFGSAIKLIIVHMGSFFDTTFAGPCAI